MKIGIGATRGQSVWRNTGMLFLVQMLNYLMPLILIPYLARVLGVEHYGVYAFGMSIYLIGMLIADYGFPVQGVFAIAESREDRDKVARLLGGMLVIKLAIFGGMAAAVGVFVWLSERYAEHRLFLMLMTLPLLGAALQFRWFFQAMEDSGRIFRYTVGARVLHVLLVVALVAGPADYLWVPIAQGIAQIAAGLLCMSMIRSAGYRFALPSWGETRAQLLAASSYFWAALAGANLGFVGVFVLGLVVQPAQLAVYGAAEQLYRAIRSLYYPIGDALTPYMKRHADMRLFRKTFMAVTGLTVIGVALGALMAPQVIGLLFGAQYAGAAPILRILLLSLLVCVPSILIGYPLLGTAGQGDAINRIVVTTSLVATAALALLVYTGTLSTNLVALTVVLSELAILVGLVGLLPRLRGGQRRLLQPDTPH